MLETVISKIERAKKEGWTVLDLSGTGISHIPKEVFELKHLEHLRLGKYRTSKKNRITSIPKEIGGLTNLRILDFTDNKISELPAEISNLEKLEKLVLSSNRFSEFPMVVIELVEIKELFLGNNKITFLPPEIKKLTRLLSLRLNSNRFTFIPEEIFSFQELEYLYLFRNPIQDVPIELLGENGKDNVCASVKQWFKDKNEGESFIYEAKLILVGEAEAGKTSLANKLLDSNYKLNPTQPMTKGVDVIKWEFKYDQKNEFSAYIWDFGGQDIMHSTHRYFLTERSVYVLVVDIRADKTDFHYWLNIIELFGGDSPVVIVMNQKHSYRKEISESLLERFKKNILGVFYVDLKTNQGLEKLTYQIKSALKSLPHIGKEKIPKKWLSIRNDLQDKKDDFISFDEYYALSCFYGAQGEPESLRISKILHELGVFLHFQSDTLLRNTIILNRTWATEAVYLVLLDELITKKSGKVSFKDLDRVWHKYPQAKRFDLIQLMIRFLLCYEVKRNHAYIIPQLLPENPPRHDYLELFEDEIYFRYSYSSFMPKGIISQLIVTLHEYILDGIQWKTGVVIRINDAIAEIKEQYFDRYIQIRLTGKTKRNGLTIIRKELDEINSGFEKLNVIQEIHCGCEIDDLEKKPFFIGRTILERYRDNNEKIIKCNNCLKDLLVLQLLNSSIGEDKYIDSIINEVTNEPDSNYIQSLMSSENNKVEFKATFHVPVYSKDDKKFLEDEYPKKVAFAKEKDNDGMLKDMNKTKKGIEAKLLEKNQEKIVIHSSIKTLVAFANSNGGELVLGIDEDKEGVPYVFGMEKDLEKAKGKDSFITSVIDQTIETMINNSFYALIERRDWIKIEEKEVWLIRIKPSSEPVWCKKEGNGEDMFYIRREGSSTQLKGKDLVKYINERF